MEFLKRLYSREHGIYKKSPAPIDGVAHVVGVARDGEVWEYPKRRSQAQARR
jgi:hypothetical protein